MRWMQNTKTLALQITKSVLQSSSPSTSLLIKWRNRVSNVASISLISFNLSLRGPYFDIRSLRYLSVGIDMRHSNASAVIDSIDSRRWVNMLLLIAAMNGATASCLSNRSLCDIGVWTAKIGQCNQNRYTFVDKKCIRSSDWNSL